MYGVERYPKRALIFSGPMASGKSYIGFGIAAFFPEEKVKMFHSSKRLKALQAPFKSKFLKDVELAIFDGMENYEAIQEFEKYMEEFPSCNFVFNTCYPLSINDVDNKKFRLIQLKQY